MPDLDATKGTYALVRWAPTAVPEISIGRNGCIGIMPVRVGYYVYLGSAFGGGGVRGRLKHHLNPMAPLRWNIDHIKKYTQPEELWYTHDRVKRECPWARIVKALPKAAMPLAGFGSNDCKCDAGAHLFYFAARPSFQGFVRRVQEAIPGHDAVLRLDKEGLTRLQIWSICKHLPPT